MSIPTGTQSTDHRIAVSQPSPQTGDAITMTQPVATAAQSRIVESALVYVPTGGIVNRRMEPITRRECCQLLGVFLAICGGIVLITLFLRKSNK